ncbi:MAG: hypothetical protein ACRD0U_02475 [Acidimicrobiales bacterium]
MPGNLRGEVGHALGIRTRRATGDKGDELVSLAERFRGAVGQREPDHPGALGPDGARPCRRAGENLIRDHQGGCWLRRLRTGANEVAESEAAFF